MNPFKLTALVLAGVFMTTACATETKEDSTTLSVEYVTINETTYNALSRILDAYFGVKDAMVSSDAEQVRVAAEAMVAIVDELDTSTLEEATSTALMAEIDAIRYGSQSVFEAAGIEDQRSLMPALSQNMEDLVRKYGASNGSVYKQYCPMAFNDTGAYWLSNSEDVINPYFGDMMLRCGEVTEKIM
jgi:membrane fusion protein, copper/silver efflux system